ncbi:hypothetical protein MH117_09885 [Paenibacillus sp. ACRRX]|uniref:hypothetical protein n=1 Tax=Paenibacillus sp. ACRRX TaxID=2918206 RepID=UPI001EF45957|nr:hypothetical protein [Paenibacillus sp. ACRRX]MCG7407733.1 hypothetical protein [Paenibacillus sp. ACRRX]
MAKLNGVVLTAAVLEYNGEKYENVLDGKAQAGDILYVEDSNGRDYVTEGAYYVVDEVDGAGDPQITDDDGDSFDGYNIEYAVYRKVAKPQTDVPQQYREVNRKANVGERIRIVAATMTFGKYKNGDEFIVNSSSRNVDGSIDHIKVEDFTTAILDEEYVVLKSITEQPEDIIEVDGFKYRKVDRQHKIGDFVLITVAAIDLTKGNVYEIKRLDYDGDGIFFDDGEDERYFSRNTEKRQLVELIPNAAADLEKQVAELQMKLSEAEVELTKARDPRNQFAVGDQVRLISGGQKHPLSGYNNGTVYTVSDPTSEAHSGHRIQIQGGTTPNGYALPTEIVKLTQEEISQANRLKVGEFARVVGGFGDHSADRDDVVKILLDDESTQPFKCGDIDGKELTRPWFHESELVRATDEEVAEARRKLSEAERFKVGEYARTLVESDLPKGSIVKIVRDDQDSKPFKGQLLDESDFDYFTQNQLERVMPEALEWAKLGRSVGEFKVGDVVEVTRSLAGHPVGSVGVVAEWPSHFLSHSHGNNTAVKFNGSIKDHSGDVKLIAPVESVVNLAVSE